MKILVLNAGSSSQKSCLYEIASDTLPQQSPAPLWEGSVDLTHQQGAAELKVKTDRGERLQVVLPTASRTEATAQMLNTLWQGKTQVLDHPSEIEAVGHRVVHGGAIYQQSVLITDEVKATIDRLATFAPIHNPANLAGIESIEHILGTTVPQVAVFDTAFHTTLTPAAYTYPGPHNWLQDGIRRYGFHGISHSYCAQRTAQILGRDLKHLRLITCHLGNGCSLTAIRDGKSVDTTMGFTPLEGLMMGSRSGSIDPGILIHLLQQGCTGAELDQILNRKSGLLGLSGVSSDLRQVLSAIDSGNPQAQLALDVYLHRLRSHIGAMLASLGGLDVLVFTAGLGENSALIRASACEAFEFLGLKLDPFRNEQSPQDEDIAQPDSSVRVVVIHTQEEWAIAQQCWQLLQR